MPGELAHLLEETDVIKDYIKTSLSRESNI